jgi:ubiquinone/menaquinone biosynthesis C-methylase UbiE
MPQPSPRFWNRMARRYSRMKIPDQAAYEHKLGVTREYLRDDMSVLEIGCGTGGTARLHAPHVRAYRATDFSPAMIEIARARAAEAPQDNLRFDVAAVEDIPLSDGPYDAVLAMSLLHLVADLPDVLRRVHGLLAPGGLLVSSTVCLADFPWYLRAVVVVGRTLRVFPPIRTLSEAELRAALDAAGFAIEHDWAPGPRSARFLVARKA